MRAKGELFAAIVGAIIYGLTGAVVVITFLSTGALGSALIYGIIGFISGSLFICLSHIIHYLGARNE